MNHRKNFIFQLTGSDPVPQPIKVYILYIYQMTFYKISQLVLNDPIGYGELISEVADFAPNS
jgi:hypothetical protein